MSEKTQTPDAPPEQASKPDAEQAVQRVVATLDHTAQTILNMSANPILVEDFYEFDASSHDVPAALAKVKALRIGKKMVEGVYQLYSYRKFAAGESRANAMGAVPVTRANAAWSGLNLQWSPEGILRKDDRVWCFVPKRVLEAKARREREITNQRIEAMTNKSVSRDVKGAHQQTETELIEPDMLESLASKERQQAG